MYKIRNFIIFNIVIYLNSFITYKFIKEKKPIEFSFTFYNTFLFCYSYNNEINILPMSFLSKNITI